MDWRHLPVDCPDALGGVGDTSSVVPDPATSMAGGPRLSCYVQSDTRPSAGCHSVVLSAAYCPWVTEARAGAQAGSGCAIGEVARRPDSTTRDPGLCGGGRKLAATSASIVSSRRIGASVTGRDHFKSLY